MPAKMLFEDEATRKERDERDPWTTIAVRKSTLELLHGEKRRGESLEGMFLRRFDLHDNLEELAHERDFTM